MDEHLAGGSRAGRKPLLEISSLSAGYGSIQIVTDVTMSVGEGEVVALVGPNGAGKSTVLKAIAGVAGSLPARCGLTART
ncbi:MAG TPA: ATP-binding cassette domain-containing protein [Streptosporangiaceae bacterium]|nr:ATP-binding cassette domain-containing protein [Streptosporangiaceae bacterium]